MKYKEWLNEWLLNYVKPTVKQKTYARYAEIVNQHIIPDLGEIETKDITPYDLQKTISNLLAFGNLRSGLGLSTNSVNAIVSVIQSSLKTAYLSGITKIYIADKIRRPKNNEKSVSCFTLSEQKKIENAVKASGKPKLLGIILCLYTGLRIGELLALEWTDIDFQKRELKVCKTCHDAKDKDGVFRRITDKPKTQTSNRIIPLPRQIIPLLKEWKKQSKSKLVVSATSERLMSVRSYQLSYERFLKSVGVAYRGFHSLRHTFATRAVECGMDVKTLAEILGHKSPTITLNRYVHSIMEHKKEMMNRLGKNL